MIRRIPSGHLSTRTTSICHRLILYIGKDIDRTAFAIKNSPVHSSVDTQDKIIRRKRYSVEDPEAAINDHDSVLGVVGGRRELRRGQRNLVMVLNKGEWQIFWTRDG
ncbi:hypothetical protein BDR07DRAFT_1391601 [Suillus spraguei]|nr:hypothetical protein BDR07DRAFT_1410686 [Suillus spraguei]KAG2368255.1 hypothetical protein BDR07DRAFT_1391601 [Suillus spraguei]